MKRMIPSLLAALVLAGSALGTPAMAQSPAPAFDLKEQDGISAELRVVDAGAVVRWRFLKPLAEPIESIDASVAGRPLGVPAVQPYPGPGEETRALLLVDVTGPSREEAITRHSAAILIMLEGQQPHQKLAVGLFGEEMRFIIPERGAADIAAGLAGAAIEEKPSSLGDVVAAGIAALASQPGQRRGLFVFTDGASGAPLAEAELVAAARGQGVALSFVVDRSDRTQDTAPLERLADATGGQVVRPDDVVPFLRAPFARLDTGATVLFPLADAVIFPWEGPANALATIRYGGRSLVLSVPAPGMRQATWPESAAFVWRSWPVPVMAAGGAGVLALAGLGLLALRARRPAGAPAPAPVAAPPLLATLVEEPAGTVHEIRSQLVQLGRDAANDIPLQDPTVSRRHALILKTDAGFLLRNEDSRNGVFVNEAPVDEAVLEDGDVLGLGSCRLVFRLPGPAGHEPAAPTAGTDVEGP